MSLPLTRRIARAALIVAAGAAAGVGAAGSASAAPQLPAAPNLGLSALDGATGGTVDNVAKGVGKTTPNTDEVTPAAGTTVKKAVPVVKQLPTDSLAKGGVPGGKNLPVQGLPIG
ncbi:ATP-binding protein [Streptomyces sp. NPDC006967]|uniref:ATP-binding protein n=1 Tax=unclassified Streptomyces TaxID=2593676 RepID=UPI000CD50724|nr:ATP-binding protein [Streptomyces sp. SM1]